MSVNEIDVNAVNKRTNDLRNAELDMLARSSTPVFQTGVDEAMKVVAPPLPQMPTAGSTIPVQNINRWRARYYYLVLDLFLVLESIVWTAMDFIRSRRMRWAKKINDATDQTKA